MSEEKLKIGKKGAAKEIAKRLSDLRKKPISNEVLRIVSEISEAQNQQEKKIAHSNEAEI